MLDVDGGLEAAHHGPELALVGIGDMVGAANRGVRLGAHIRALGALHAGELRAGGGEAFLGLGQTHRVGGAEGADAGVVNTLELRAGSGEALLEVNGAARRGRAGSGGADKLCKKKKEKARKAKSAEFNGVQKKKRASFLPSALTHLYCGHGSVKHSLMSGRQNFSAAQRDESQMAGPNVISCCL